MNEMGEQRALSSDPLLEEGIEVEPFTQLSVFGLQLQYKSTQKNRVVLALFGLLFILCTIVFSFGFWVSKSSVLKPPVRNVILMISDGFGPASQTYARNYYQYVNKLPNTTQLPLDTILVGSSRTRSGSSFVTDSAAGATAFSCGLKTYNGAIAVDMNGKPCGTVLEAAKERGMLTGLVATSRITHATPAAFAAHVSLRDEESEIAIHEIGNQTLGRRVDLLFGGGKCFFLPKSDPQSCRTDNTDVFKMAEKFDWTVGTELDDFYSLSEQTRDPAKQPSLKEMSLKAIDLLDKNARKQNTGFFLMIEGSRIDMAAHSNNPAAHVHDILAYNEAIDQVKQYVRANPDTIMISVSDHETGGFSVAHQLGSVYPEYNWYPQYVVPVKHSGEYIAQQLLAQTAFDKKTFVKDIVLKRWLGITNPNPVDIEYLASNKTFTEIDFYLGKITSDLAGLGWSSHGHSAVDVNLYAYGANSHELKGNHENTDIGEFIVRNLHLDVNLLTKKLNTFWN